MKKTMIAVLALALMVALFCGTAFATYGDVTVKSAKVYSNAEMTNYVGTIPAYTSLVVRGYDKFADIYLNGKLYYISNSALLGGYVKSDYTALLKKGTKVYQRPTTSANRYTLKSDGRVKLCKVKGSWALVQTLGARGLFAFVKVDKLSSLEKD